MKTRNLAALLLVTWFYACNNPKRTDKVIDSAISAVTETKADTLAFAFDSIKIYSKIQNSKIKQPADTAKAVISYPVFKDQSINKFLEDRVIGLAGKQGHYKTYKELTAGFIKEYDTFKSTASQSESAWFLDMNLKVVTNYPNYLSVLYRYVDYKGGAHPNTLFTYFNYDPKLIKQSHLIH
ncbi:PdaC/SigV domain-containing protein [Pedobacter sp. NJ-S-72]